MVAILASGILVFICSSLFDAKSTVGTLIRLIGGLLLSFVILSPVAKWDFEAILTFTESFDAVADLAAECGCELASEEVSRIIREELSAYILEKASALQADLTIDVILSEDPIPTPESVKLMGTVTPYAKGKLQRILSEELGIPRERQIWTGEIHA